MTIHAHRHQVFAWLIVIAGWCCAMSFALPAHAQVSAIREDAGERTRYRVEAEINFDALTFTGVERVRWTNDRERPTNVLYFSLYANLRSDSAPDQPAPDEPQIEVAEVRLITDGREAGALPFALEERGSMLRVNLRAPVARRAEVEVEIKFRGRVPEIEADETGLLAHVVQGVDAALRDSREVRRARDFNFRSRGVMLLGAWYPVLAVRGENGEWQRKSELSLGRVLFAEPADYEVRIGVSQATEGSSLVEVFAPGVLRLSAVERNGVRRYTYAGEMLRDFALVVGRGLRAVEAEANGVQVRSVFPAEQERMGRRVLDVARAAATLYTDSFGRLPFRHITILAAPLAAGRGSIEFAGMSVVASAFYIDFDAPAARNLPEIVREQRASVEDSLEWTIAQGVAHQWWGAGAVGNDPHRAPVLDEGLANWSALHYYRTRHGEARAAQAMEDQLRGVYSVYRTFGGDDLAADRAASDYRNSFQYAAIISSKGALLFEALRAQLGEERFNSALRDYYQQQRLKIANADDLRFAFTSSAKTPDERRSVARTFNRWLNERRGDEDIAPPNTQLAADLGIPAPESASDGDNKSATNEAASRPNRFARVGRFFWKQMTRIR